MRKILALIWACFIFTGCATATVGGYVVPGAKLPNPGTYYVVFDPSDDRATHELIRTSLEQRGLDAKSGFADRMPNGVDVVVRYGSRWQWDITWYLLELDVRFYEPESSLLIASANSLRTSLARKSPDDVVAEVLNQLFPAEDKETK